MTQQDDEFPRSAARLNFFLSAVVSCAGQKDLPARIRNLSVGGMMVEFTSDPDIDLEVGESIVAEMRNIGRVKGEIAWSESGRYGVKFAREIDPEQARKPKMSGSGTPDHAKGLIVADRNLKNARPLRRW